MDVDLKKLSAEIANGEHDGNLTQIMEAIRHRFANGPGVTRWALRYDGGGDEGFAVEVTEDDLTLSEAEQIEKATGLNWAQVDPIVSAKCCTAIIAVALASRKEMSRRDADAHAGSIPAGTAIDCISRYEVSPGPLDSAASSTP